VSGLQPLEPHPLGYDKPLSRCPEMERAARNLTLQPARISFRHSLMLVRTFLLVTAWAFNPANRRRQRRG